MINDLVEEVASTFHNRSGINVTESLEEALKILEEIKSRNFTEDNETASSELRYYEFHFPLNFLI